MRSRPIRRSGTNQGERRGRSAYQTRTAITREKLIRGLRPAGTIKPEFAASHHKSAPVDAAGTAREQQGKVEHHAHLFELMFVDVLADVQPQTEYEERVSQGFAGGHEQPGFRGGVSSVQIVLGRNPEIAGDILNDNLDVIAKRSISKRRSRIGL